MQKSKRGFASMTKEQMKSIASRGGKAAHKKGTAHQWSPAEAKEAGRKGGLLSRYTKRPNVPLSEARKNFLKRLENL